MLDARVMTIVRNGGDYLEECLSVVAPHVKAVQVMVDSRSSDDTVEVLERLAGKFSNLSYSVFPINRPGEDLVKMRNQFFPFDEAWGFIIDSDEYHYAIEKYQLPEGGNAVAFQCWSVWNETHAHRSSSRAIIGRIFKNSPGLVWRGQWGKEVLYDCGEPVFVNALLTPHRYLHFTHLKKDKWREEMKQLRVADGKYLTKMPDSIIKITKSIHEKMPTMQYREV